MPELMTTYLSREVQRVRHDSETRAAVAPARTRSCLSCAFTQLLDRTVRVLDVLTMGLLGGEPVQQRQDGADFNRNQTPLRIHPPQPHAPNLDALVAREIEASNSEGPEQVMRGTGAPDQIAALIKKHLNKQELDELAKECVDSKKSDSEAIGELLLKKNGTGSTRLERLMRHQGWDLLKRVFSQCAAADRGDGKERASDSSGREFWATGNLLFLKVINPEIHDRAASIVKQRQRFWKSLQSRDNAAATATAPLTRSLGQIGVIYPYARIPEAGTKVSTQATLPMTSPERETKGFLPKPATTPGKDLARGDTGQSIALVLDSLLASQR